MVVSSNLDARPSFPKNVLGSRCNKQVTTDLFIYLAELVLNNIIVSFQIKLKKILGTIIATTLAPPYAIHFVAVLGEKT